MQAYVPTATHTQTHRHTEKQKPTPFLSLSLSPCLSQGQGDRDRQGEEVGRSSEPYLHISRVGGESEGHPELGTVLFVFAELGQVCSDGVTRLHTETLK